MLYSDGIGDPHQCERRTKIALRVRFFSDKCEAADERFSEKMECFILLPTQPCHLRYWQKRSNSCVRSLQGVESRMRNCVVDVKQDDVAM